MGKGTARAGVRISNDVEVGDVWYLSVSHKAALHSTIRFRSSPGKGKRGVVLPVTF